jgi:hypothetical protein
MLSGPSGARWDEARRFAEKLVYACGGATRTGESVLNYERNLADPDDASRVLAKVQSASDGQTLRAALADASKLNDPAVYGQALSSAVANAVSGKTKLWDELVKMAKLSFSPLKEMRHEGHTILEWLERKQAEGVQLSVACRNYIAESRRVAPETWAYGHSASQHAPEILARVAVGEVYAQAIAKFWIAQGETAPIRGALVEAGRSGSLPAPLRALAMEPSLAWTDDEAAQLPEEIRALLAPMIAAQAAEKARMEQLAADIARRNAERAAKM